MTKKAKARTAKVSPTYLDEGKSFSMGLQDVVRVLKLIEKHDALDRFSRAAKRNKESQCCALSPSQVLMRPPAPSTMGMSACVS